MRNYSIVVETEKVRRYAVTSMSDFLSRLAAPIAGDSPFGADVNHDPDYERLKGEIGKLGEIDISAVETLSLRVLTEKSKDLRAMAWFAYAALRRNDLSRLADIFCLLAGCCQDNFEQIFPRRESAKLAALRWLSEPRFTSCCPKAEAAGPDAPHVFRLKTALDRLRPALEKRFPSTGAPFPLLLYKRVLEWEKALSVSIQNGVDAAGAACADQSVERSVINETRIDESARKNGNPPPAAPEDNKDIRPATVTVKLTHNEYQEMLSCINKVVTLLKKCA